MPKIHDNIIFTEKPILKKTCAGEKERKKERTKRKKERKNEKKESS